MVEIRKQTPKRSRQPEDASLLRFISECSGISFHVLVGLARQSLPVSFHPSDSLSLSLSLLFSGRCMKMSLAQPGSLPICKYLCTSM